MGLSDIDATQVRKPRPEVNKRVKIYRLSEMVPHIQQNSRGHTKLVGADLSAETELVYQRFAPRSMGVYHVHRHAENIWFVIQGEMEAIIGGVRYRVKAGELVFMPSGVPHATGNSGDVDVLALEIYVPPPDHFEPRDAFPADLPKAITDAATTA
jgi:mannose-6-phosphate isomerase-like protein (cupin superfamily)